MPADVIHNAQVAQILHLPKKIEILQNISKFMAEISRSFVLHEGSYVIADVASD
ncbi:MULTISPECIES: hypothetical protein [Sphingobium]|uniref:hypothetical protein n=1 Tax=Sphingobium TaxID=165695 RepID=UPI0013759820|nr:MULTISPECIES: hypothetical protein [Sphingobium]